MGIDIDTRLKDILELIQEYKNEGYGPSSVDCFADWLIEKTIAVKTLRADIEHHKERLNAYRAELAEYKRSL